MSVALFVFGCAETATVEETSIEPPLPDRMESMDSVLVEHIERRVSAVKDAPEESRAWMQLGLLYEAHEIYELANLCYEQASQLDPQSQTAWYHLALMQHQTGAVESAVESLIQVRELGANYAPASWRRGSMLLELGRIDDAEAAFQEALELAPQDAAARTGLARVALRRSEPEKAVEILETLLKEKPGRAYLHHLLGSAYRMLEQWDRAEYELVKGRNSREVWTDPWGHEAMTHRVEFYVLLKQANAASDRGMSASAIATMEQLLEKKPEDRRTLTGLSRAYLRAGREQEARALADRLLKLYPDHFEVQLLLASIEEHLGKLDQALGYVDRSIALNAEYAPTHRRRATILARQRRFTEAAAGFQQAVRLAPEDAVAWGALGDTMVQLRRWEDAAFSFVRVLRLQPEDATAMLKLGFAQMQLGDLEGARSMLMRAEQSSPESAATAAMMLNQIEQIESGAGAQR